MERSNEQATGEGVRFFIQFINANSEVYFIYNYLVAIYAIKKVQVFNLVNKTRPWQFTGLIFKFCTQQQLKKYDSSTSVRTEIMNRDTNYGHWSWNWL